ncbi:hypothetical protein P3T27_006822 [Kitasatospora sp. MAA19]|uniref:hypothetical protein n=1 Tax=Kitasatospora sp. MAA19 TaxID=3035090 RepID=UPI002476DCE3|nr:hypothetical protein [Kitasatospora sp. MAA19]MDH6710073.1 hypothetical protein [Kitasatospora sp. MAA19]
MSSARSASSRSLPLTSDRTVHWWRRTWPGHTRAGYPPVALVVTDAGPVALANRQQNAAELSAEVWGGQWCTVRREDNDGDGWRVYDDAVPVVVTTLELLAEPGPLGPVWWRYGRPGRHCLTDALDNPDNRTAYDQCQKAREKKARQAHHELMQTLACADCGQVPKQKAPTSTGSTDSGPSAPAATATPATTSTRNARRRPPPRLSSAWRRPGRPTPRCAGAGRAGARLVGRRAHHWNSTRRRARTGWSARSA